MKKNNNYNKFEHYCIEKHFKEYNHITYHWTNVPDEILVKCNYFTSLEEIRLKREKYKKYNNYNDSNNYTREYGLDGISVEYIDDNNILCHGIQVKYWNKNKILDASHLGTFLDVIMNKFNLHSKGHLYFTCKIGNEFKKNCINGNKIFLHNIDDPFTKLNNKNNSIILRDYQIKAIEKLKEEWYGKKLLVLPCGTGKTLIYINYCKEMNFSNIFIISPTIALCEQNGERFHKIMNKDIIYINTFGIRNIEEITIFLNKHNIFTITYDSFEDLFKNLLDKIDINNSILIVDEAHNLINRNNMVSLINKFNKCLLVTATPPFSMYEILDCSLIYEYKLKDAINNKYICDYEIFLPYIKNINIPFQLLNIDDDICKKCLFLVNGMLEKGKRNCIIYLKNKQECYIYKNIIEKIMNNYHYYNTNIDIISSDINKIKREKILEKFRKYENVEMIKILLSIRILDEGIDLINCDSVFLTSIGNKENDIRNIQRVFRSNRIDHNNLSKKSAIFIWCDEFEKLVETFGLLKMTDINFYKKIK